MTSNNQVSPVIRISRGERDASARATHLKAASRKYLETTIERKQMSTTTNFKRIALVAVAALGLGVLSSVPSQAAVSGLTVTVVNGTSSAAKSDSTTAATFTIAGFVGPNDTIVAYVVAKTAPAAAGAVRPVFFNLDSTTPTLSTQRIDTTTSAANTSVSISAGVSGGFRPAVDTVLATQATVGGIRLINASGDANISHKFGFQLDTTTETRAAGTYTYSLVVKTFEVGATGNGTAATTTTTRDISIVVAALATESAVAASATSTALLYGAGTWAQTATDSTVAAAGTAGGAAVATVKVDLLNAAGGQTTVRDSITVSIDKGNAAISTSNPAAASPSGKSLAAFSYTGSSTYVTVWPDGSNGPATLTIRTLNAGTFTKTITFYGDGASAKATVVSAVIGSSGTGAILGTEADALNNDLGGGTSLFAYSSDTSVISNFGTACGTYNTTFKGVLCDLTGVKSGTANITLRDASTVALSKTASNAVAVRVSIGEVATRATITFNKSSYAPGERVTAIVRVLDANGLTMPAGTYNNVFTAAAITTSSQLTWAAGESLTATSVTTAGNTTASATAPVVSTEPIAQYTYFLPTTGGNVVFTATGGTGLATAGQVAVTGTATVVDSAASALAAVTALATTVASLRTLIVTLTNLVLKIQKKVRA
jgi:trimeric autotransporter adhesin